MLTWQLALLFLSLGIAVAAVMVVIVMANRSAREAKVSEQRLSKRIDVLESELSAMMDGAFGVANHLQKVETNLKDTVQRQEQLQQRDMGNLPYNEAVRLASKGAGVDELVEHCGLTRSEAELVEMLHKKSPPMITSEHEIQDVEASSRQPAKAAVEGTSATEQVIENLMSEHMSQLQVDPLRGAIEAAASEQSITQPAAHVSESEADQSQDENVDERKSLADALARTQAQQSQQAKPVKPTSSEQPSNPPVENKPPDDRH